MIYSGFVVQKNNQNLLNPLLSFPNHLFDRNHERKLKTNKKISLKRRDILESLIKHVTETPADHLDENERFKYANQSCVLFSSKSTQMEYELIQQQDLLDRLVDFLKTDEELNPLMASFFANTLFSIYAKFTEQMISYLNGKPDFFDQLFKHIHISAIMDFLLKITTLESIIGHQKPLDVYKVRLGECSFFLMI